MGKEKAIFCETCPLKGSAQCELIGIQKAQMTDKTYFVSGPTYEVGVLRDANGDPSEPIYMRSHEEPEDLLDAVKQCKGSNVEMKTVGRWRWKKDVAQTNCGALASRKIEFRQLLYLYHAKNSVLGRRMRVPRV